MVYVRSKNVKFEGRRSRSQELMFPSKPTGFSFIRPYLCLFSEYQIIVFNVVTAEWIQTLSLKRARPLDSDGRLVLCHVLDNVPHLAMLTTITPCKLMLLSCISYVV